MALDLQKLLDKLLVRALTSTYFDQFFARLPTRVEDQSVSAKFDYHKKCFGNSEVVTLNLRNLLDKLLAQALTLKPFHQSSPDKISLSTCKKHVFSFQMGQPVSCITCGLS